MEQQYGKETLNYLQLDGNLKLHDLLSIMGVCFGCLVLFGILEKLLIKYQSHKACPYNVLSRLGDIGSLICACIIYSVALFYLYGHNFEKTNFCLMNSDATCDDVDVNCFTFSKTSNFINTVQFEGGALIELTATGNRINYFLHKSALHIRLW